MADSSDSDEQAVTDHCPRIPPFDNLDCGGQNGTARSKGTRIGSGHGTATLTKADHGSTWDYTIRFYPDASRPETTYTLRETQKDYPEIEVSPDLPMAPNCGGRPCWTISITGCRIRRGRKHHYLCVNGRWYRLVPVGFRADEGEREDSDGEEFWAVPEHALEKMGEGPPFIGTRLAMGAE